MDNSPMLVRIDDYLLEITISGEVSSGVELSYKVIHKEADHEYDHDFIEKQLNILINKIMAEKLNLHD